MSSVSDVLIFHLFWSGLNDILWRGHGPYLCIASICDLVLYPLFSSKPYSGYNLEASTIISSRITLANIDAMDTVYISLSAFTYGLHGMGVGPLTNLGVDLPSTTA